MSHSSCIPMNCSPASLLCPFPRQEYWHVFPFPSLGDLLDPGIKPRFPALVAGFIITETLGKPDDIILGDLYLKKFSHYANVTWMIKLSIFKFFIWIISIVHIYYLSICFSINYMTKLYLYLKEEHRLWNHK